jgi:threonine aldolase
MVDRLAEDHVRAKKLAAGLRAIPGLTVDEPPTNMVFFNLADSVRHSVHDIEHGMKERGVLIESVGKSRRFRFVTHYWIDDAGIERAIQALRQVIAE